MIRHLLLWNIGLRKTSCFPVRVSVVWKLVWEWVPYSLSEYLANHRPLCISGQTKWQNGAKITLNLDYQSYRPTFFYLEVIVKWRRFSSPGRRFSGMPKWRSLRMNDGGLTCRPYELLHIEAYYTLVKRFFQFNGCHLRFISTLVSTLRNLLKVDDFPFSIQSVILYALLTLIPVRYAFVQPCSFGVHCQQD